MFMKLFYLRVKYCDKKRKQGKGLRSSHHHVKTVLGSHLRKQINVGFCMGFTKAMAPISSMYQLYNGSVLT